MKLTTAAQVDDRGGRQDQARPGQGGTNAPSDREESERPPEGEKRKERRRPETLPPTTTSGGIPSEPGWMR